MSIKETFKSAQARLKLDSHHTMERSGIFFGAIALTGAMILSSAAVAATVNGQGEFENKAVWSESFTTSKTNMNGEVDGVYTNSSGNRALILMHFDKSAQISTNAADYQAWLLGSNESMDTVGLKTPNITAQMEIFGSTGYMGVLLESDEPFAEQVVNLTMRSNAELAGTGEGATDSDAKELAEDDVTFRTYDQWRIYVNPGATKAKPIEALESNSFDPAQAYYETVAKVDETEAKDKLDAQLVEMRTNLSQIEAYTKDLATTKVDGLYLRPPEVPSLIDGDEITGESVSEADDGKSTLSLKTDTVAPGGFNINWRAGDIYTGYLESVVPDGESYVKFLADKAKGAEDTADDEKTDVSDLRWLLSDGTDLANDYSGSDTTMRPLTSVMNNLSQAYQDYATNKKKYQSDLTLGLLTLDVDLRDVQTNSSIRSDEDFFTPYYG